MGAGVYVHVPFCTGKCHYCSFVSVPFDPGIAAGYVDALKTEFSRRPPQTSCETLYIGGGTPTVLGDAALSSLVKHFLSHPSISGASEVTVEANPDSLGAFDIRPVADAGVNRVSLGAQSFDPAELKMLGRRHTPGDVEASVRKLRAAGIDNLSLDLIYALPGQDTASWVGNLERAVSLGPEHISLYDLSFEEGTPFFRDAASGKISKPPEPVQAEMYLAAVELLAREGYFRYEISNFARPGYECRHNLNYWAGGEYTGYGASASSYADGARRENMRSIKDYMDAAVSGRDTFASEERLSEEQRRKEMIMLSLRTSEGLSLYSYMKMFGQGFMECYSDKVERLESAGYIAVVDGRLRLSDKGILASSAVISEFF